MAVSELMSPWRSFRIVNVSRGSFEPRGRIMQTLILYGVFAASFVYVSPLAVGKWQSRATAVIMLCLVATAGALRVATDQ